MTIFEAKQFGNKEINSPTTSLDVNCILEYITGFSKTQLLLNSKNELSVEQESIFLEAIKKRQTGLPIAYITGHKEFYGYDFFVTPDVLIPKPDTEILVEKTLDVIWNNSFYKNNDFFFTDVCTGSGCIAIALKKRLHNATVTAIDLSDKALEIATENTQRLM